MSNFIIFTTQRSGSTWLIDKLNSHKDIVAFESVFMRNAKLGTKTKHGQDGLEKWKLFNKDEKNNIKFRSRRVISYLNKIYYGDIINSNKNTSRGFKFMYNDIIWYPELFPYILKHKLKIIHLYRKNILDVIVSVERMNKTNQAHYFKQPSQIEKVTLDVSFLKVRMYKRFYQHKIMHLFLKNLRLPYYSVSYEDLFSNESCFLDVVRFIGNTVADIQLNSNLKKISASRHRDSISNYEDVHRCLNETRFSWMLR